MKPTDNIYVKSFSRSCFILLTAMVLASFFSSCTTDEIDVQPQNETIEESLIQPKDSIGPTTAEDTPIIPPQNPIKPPRP